ncbi:MAG: YlxM family DNA-binding protein [Firmicutes bacterium]|nr:YlxM family DNA-binding protein [Bacillota bacterium]
MDDILQATLLFDFYGELLTEKQKNIFSMYHLEDLTLSEIGEEQGISRQAVRDQLKRTENILIEYEKKLKLVEKFQEHQNAIKKIKSLAEDFETKYKNDNQAIGYIERIKDIADDILD